MKYVYQIAILMLVTALYGCDISIGNEHAFSSTDSEYMNNFEILLKKRNIPYKLKDEKIWYTAQNIERVDDVRKTLSSTSSVKYDEVEVRNYFHKLLDSRGMEYIDQKRPDGVWIMWFPKNEEQEQEIQLKVVEYAFSLKVQERTKQDCNSGNSSTPSNKTLNHDAQKTRAC